MIRRTFALGALVASTLAAAPLALAHHGLMLWNTDKVYAIDGFIAEELDGFPHWEFEVRVDGVDWVIDVGNELVLERAGLPVKSLTVGTNVSVEGYRTASSTAHRLKPIKVIMNGNTYTFQTDWD